MASCRPIVLLTALERSRHCPTAVDHRQHFQRHRSHITAQGHSRRHQCLPSLQVACVITSLCCHLIYPFDCSFVCPSIISFSSFVVVHVAFRELLAVTDALRNCRQVQKHDHTSFDAQSGSAPNSSPSNSLSKLLQQSELLLFKLDETLQEARQAREGMMLYLQVCK